MVLLSEFCLLILSAKEYDICESDVCPGNFIVESSVRRFGGPSFSRIWAEDALMAEKPQLGAL